MTELTSQGHDELQHYLSRATRGLWGRQREQVRSELEEHLLEHAGGLIVFGTHPDEALSRAIRELGPPERMCSAMNQVYLMPKVIQFSAFSACCALLVTLSLSLPGQGHAQVAVTNLNVDKPVCAVSSAGMKSSNMIEVLSQKGNLYCYRFRSGNSSYYFDLNSLERTLKPLGVTVSRLGNRTALKFPDARQSTTLRTALDRNGDRFARLQELPFNFVGSGLPVTVTGWTNPVVQVGRISFTLGDASAPAPASVIYESVLLDVIHDLNLGGQGVAVSSRANPASPKLPYFNHTVHVDAPAGTVIGIFSRDARGLPLIDEAPVGAGGRVSLYAPREKLRFVTDAAELTPHLSGGRGQALLVRLTGLIASPDQRQKGKYVIIRPLEEASDGVR